MGRPPILIVEWPKLELQKCNGCVGGSLFFSMMYANKASAKVNVGSMCKQSLAMVKCWLCDVFGPKQQKQCVG